MTSFLLNCLVCHTQYSVPLSRIIKGRGATCSKDCATILSKGKHFSPNSEFEKGQEPWNKGIDYFPSHYKGDDVGLRSLHRWVEVRLGKPSLCEHCGTTEAKIFDWSNISGNYLRDLSDWQRLCRRCHMIFDGHRIDLINKRRVLA